MVARANRPKAPLTTSVASFLSAWRVGVSTVVDRLWRDARTYRTLLLGFAAVSAGAIVAVTSASGAHQRSLEASGGAAALIWAGARWWIARRSLGNRHQSRTNDALWLGSLPWVVGWSPDLRVGAWLASAVLTWFLLERAGVERRGALRAVTRAWGAHAAFAVAWTVAVSVSVIALAS